ncbi:MAG: nickel pincer cofactor biosynthesis protein LarC [Candidatus Eremiobacteraeota bacterium]|nr:nickel pincer cofactor biosynthesis protein LarC [Candidatus Eremiobacteraeota bacterium]
MKVAYFDMIGGASGNMLLGALLDAGADFERLQRALTSIPVDGWSIERARVVKLGLAAEYFDFVIPGEDHHAHEGSHRGHGRHLADVLDIVERSGLTPAQKRRARTIYERLALAEAKVHGTTPDRIHFHEVGAVDAILDVAGTCVALDLLGVEAVYSSAFPVGRGSISMAHGRYPNPPPATAELLRGFATYDAGIEGEMVTTTGAAILTALVERPGVRPAMIAQSIGYGAGRSDFAIPNVLRAWIGVAPEALQDATSDEIAVLEANIDDMSPQHYELAIERTLAAGAFDVWLAPVTMKKLRPAVLFGAVAPLEREADVARAMLNETTTLGVRARRERRYTLARKREEIVTELGTVRVKTAYVEGVPRRTLEYDDVVRIARERRRPIAEIAARLQELVASDGDRDER